ncbi:MAG: DUF2760 domain-containing protein [Deltaproteobacteria bacterium]|nr:DUF2760 domain-containing protein [Deltaproteobacteria bacterium]
MDGIKRHIRRSFWWILLWMTLFGAGFYAALVWLNTHALGRIEAFLATREPAPVQFLAELAAFLRQFQVWATAAIPVGIVLVTVLLWLTLRGGAKKAAIPAGPTKKAAAREREQPADKELAARMERERAIEDERKSLLLLAMFQREGRLMDFFAEDLSRYEDEQIGAAVRGVQDACARLVDKHVKPRPIMDAEEGETVTVPAGFDPSAVKLTGRVSGEPPFKGILRHRGWMAGRVDLPSVSAAGDPRIIAPAEVEIV